MQASIRIGLVAAACALALSGCGSQPGAGGQAAPDMVSIPAGTISYRLPGEFLSGDALVPAPQADVSLERPISIMRRQVSQAEYAACVQDGGCRALDKDNRGQVAPDRPVVGVSWVDATAYAAWLSGKTGQAYRLPTYQEWAHAAGSAFQDIDIIDIGDGSNPALRWLEEYRRETNKAVLAETSPQPFGTFGTASTGLQDIGGNVWDWTDTCYTRQWIGQDGAAAGMPAGQHCGIRVLAGRHVGYIPDFIRDPRSGACSVGIPPANLGFRLVRDLLGISAASWLR